MAYNPRVALVTGGSRGVGYFIGKELLKNIPSLTCYMAARDVENLSGHSALLGMELGRSETKIKILKYKDIKNIF